MSFGLQPEAGVLAPADKMISLGGSHFGSTFYTSEKVGNASLHFRPTEHSVNWVPENLVEGLGMLAVSVKNVVAYLLALAGEPLEKCELSAPDDDEAFKLPWAKSCGLTNGSFKVRFGPEHIANWTADEIVDRISESWARSDQFSQVEG
jgi:hypothetical protein